MSKQYIYLLEDGPWEDPQVPPERKIGSRDYKRNC